LLRDEHRRVWSRTTLLELGCGWEHGRVIVPIRNLRGELRGVLRYAPSRDHAPKMFAVRGSRLGLIPHPAAEPSSWIVLVEGPPDMISAPALRGCARSPVPGDDAWWEAEWAQLLRGRCVSVVLDCDRAGRDTADRIARDLKAADVRGSVVDLAPDRQDGYDLTEWLDGRRGLARERVRAGLAAPDTRPGSRRAQPSGQ
jgi:hypothetical protein